MLRWFDPEVGETRREEGLCVLLRPLDDPGRFVCSRRHAAAIFDVDAGGLDPVRQEGSGASDYAQTFLRGGQFTPVDGRYLVYMSIEGDLRATTFDPEDGTVGRPVTLLSGVRREALKGAGQFAIATNGSLVIAYGDNAEHGMMVRSAGQFSNASTGQTTTWLGSVRDLGAPVGSGGNQAADHRSHGMSPSTSSRPTDAGSRSENVSSSGPVISRSAHQGHAVASGPGGVVNRPRAG